MRAVKCMYGCMGVCVCVCGCLGTRERPCETLNPQNDVNTKHISMKMDANGSAPPKSVITTGSRYL